MNIAKKMEIPLIQDGVIEINRVNNKIIKQ